MYGAAIGTAIASNGDKQHIDNMAVTKSAHQQPTREKKPAQFGPNQKKTKLIFLVPLGPVLSDRQLLWLHPPQSVALGQKFGVVFLIF